VLEEAHGLAAWGLIGLVGLHVAAALKHQFIDKDGLLERMRPGGR
jgi:cytochrome b561